MLSEIFVRRPRLAFVISIVITLVGVLAMVVIPVDQYPDITPPKIMVRANYPGADAATGSCCTNDTTRQSFWHLSGNGRFH